MNTKVIKEIGESLIAVADNIEMVGDKAEIKKETDPKEKLKLREELNDLAIELDALKDALEEEEV